MQILWLLLIILSDQGLKYWISHNLLMGERQEFIPGFMQLTYVTNKGGAWSLFSGHINVLILLSVVVILYLTYLMWQVKEDKAQRLIYILILGGAIGNLIDRLFLGYVVDMFELTLFNFPVFNLADTAICIGVGFMMIQVLFDKNTSSERNKS